MDVNNTRFKLLVGHRDWGPLIPTPKLFGKSTDPRCGLAWDADRAAVGLRGLIFRFPKDERHALDERRATAGDRFGHWYRINVSETGLDMIPSEEGEAFAFWPGNSCETEQPEDGVFAPVTAAPEAPSVLRGLTVTTHHYLVAGTLDPAGLLLFDLHGGGPPLHLRWPETMPFAPIALAPRPGGGVWILDFDSDSERPPRAWALNRYFHLEHREGHSNGAPPGQGGFRSLDGVLEAVCTHAFPAGLTEDHAVPLDAGRPISLAVLPDDTLLTLSSGAEGETVLRRFEFGNLLSEPIDLREMLMGGLDLAMEEEEDLDILESWRGNDMAFVPRGNRRPHIVQGTLYVAGRDGNQAFAFDLEAEGDRLTLNLTPRFFPMRRFGGRGLAVAGRQAFYDMESGRQMALTAQPKPRYCREGSLVTNAFDSDVPECVWHRIFVDACIPPGTAVRVESRAADDTNALAGTPWQEEPAPYRRKGGAEIPHYRPFTEDEERRDGTGTWELLLQRARGRFCQLRLTLLGTGRSTPRVHALRLYYPRFSYLKEYLPDVYQEDEVSASFLDRYLANVEGLFTDLEGRIAEVQQLFDERITDDDYLDWLAGWFGVILEPAYDEDKRRVFIRHAAELFTQRGTQLGLMRAVRLALDPCADDSLFEVDEDDDCIVCGMTVDRHGIRIIEEFLTRRARGLLHGDSTDLTGPRLTNTSEKWTIKQGSEPLHEHFRRFLEAKYGDSEALAEIWGDGAAADLNEVQLSPVAPADSGQLQDWLQFTRDELGFTYAEVTAEDADHYRDFLIRRYRQIDRLSQVHLTDYSEFETVPLPGENEFPTGGPRLADWIEFVSHVLPMKRKAHRFSVLVPYSPEEAAASQTQRIELVRRIVDQQKPAHTAFDVKLYWALFRVGAARLGVDTLLDEGSRFVALLLGQGHLAGAYLAPAHPWNASDRFVTGRDRPGALIGS